MKTKKLPTGTDNCVGPCYNFNKWHTSCSMFYHSPHIKICPCEICLIKVVCKESCEALDKIYETKN